MESIEIREIVPLKGHYDVVVAGGGVAGVAAAVAARRCGKDVLLIEKSMKFGGLATLGLINLFVPMCNGRGKQIIFGMAEELLRLSIKYGYDTIPECWQNGEPGDPESKGRYMTRYSAEIFALALTELLNDEGAHLLFDSVVARPVMTGQHCDGVIVENKSGREYYTAAMVIDTTGDADVLFRAQVPTIQGGNYFTYAARKVTLDTCQKAIESGKINHIFAGESGGTASLYGHNHPKGMPLFTGTSSEDVNDYLLRNQLLVLERIKGDDRWSRDIVTLPGMAQFRTTRCIDGDYILREGDAYRHFDDSVGAICDFDRRDYLFEIPYRCLIRSGFDNLITAGRCAAGEGYGWDVLRVIPPAIISGQAAGVAAAQAIDTHRAVYAIDIPALQQSLADADVVIHFDDALVPPDAERATDGECENVEERQP